MGKQLEELKLRRADLHKKAQQAGAEAATWYKLLLEDLENQYNNIQQELSNLQNVTEKS